MTFRVSMHNCHLRLALQFGAVPPLDAAHMNAFALSQAMLIDKWNHETIARFFDFCGSSNPSVLPSVTYTPAFNRLSVAAERTRKMPWITGEALSKSTRNSILMQVTAWHRVLIAAVTALANRCWFRDRYYAALCFLRQFPLRQCTAQIPVQFGAIPPLDDACTSAFVSLQEEGAAGFGSWVPIGAKESVPKPAVGPSRGRTAKEPFSVDACYAQGNRDTVRVAG